MTKLLNADWYRGLNYFINRTVLHSINEVIHKGNTKEITTVAVVLYVIKFHVNLHKLEF